LIKAIIIKWYKNWITNGSTASTYLVIAQTDVEKDIRESMLLLLKRFLILDQKKENGNS
jgi:alkylation response protein AidB-like acyl-CoA dehydrogenase